VAVNADQDLGLCAVGEQETTDHVQLPKFLGSSALSMFSRVDLY
jgi:hypothetical protein